MTEVIGMPAEDLAAFRENPIWPVRAAAAGTILRELEAEADPAASLERLGKVARPVLQSARRGESAGLSRGHGSARRAAR